MKKLLLLIVAVTMTLSACAEENSDINQGENQEKEERQDQEANNTKQEEEPTEQSEKSLDQKENEGTEENTIDISMYDYTENIEITDALEVNNHITLMIDMNPSPKPGLAFQHVLNGTYDFLQQDIVRQADTVGINVRQNGVKIAMFTAHPKEFSPDDERSMADVVLEASIVEMMSQEVEQYTEAFEFPIKTE